MSKSNLSPSFASYCYPVFLSFRGTDVRTNFLECFYDTLIHSSIDAFVDAKGLQLGDPVMPKLLRNIQDAKICIPILSVDFASSQSCLMEVEQMVASNKTILPIFYGIKPSVVRYQSDTYETSFTQHSDAGVPEETIKKWKSALSEVSWRIGEELPDVDKGYHELIKEVINRLQELLRMDHQELPKRFVNIDDHVLEVLRKLGARQEDEQVVMEQELTDQKRVVVIWGLQGIGKTTLAKVVYNRIRPLFRTQGSCFLGGIRGEIDGGKLLSLQQKLIDDLQGRTCVDPRSRDEGHRFIKYKFEGKGVFIVLDDVHDFGDIVRLMDGLEWLGPGSRVIVTTSSRDIIDSFDDRVVLDYEVGQMLPDKAELLFCKHAFRSDSPSGAFAESAKKIIPLLRGNPRSVELVGGSLYRKNIDLWKEMEQMLERGPEENMKKFLKWSYEKLNSNAQHILLDIACLFNGMDKKIPSYLWNSCGKYPEMGMTELCNLSWLKFGENKELLMPKLIEIFGKMIVKEEGGDNPLKRSRVWDHEDAQALHNLEEDKETVEALWLAYESPPSRGFSYSELGFLPQLHVLRLCRATLGGESERPPVLPNLRWLAWKGCSAVSDLRPFHEEKLLILDLSSSIRKQGVLFMKTAREKCQEQRAAKAWQEFLGRARELKVLNLLGSRAVSNIFPLPEGLVIERLILESSEFSSTAVPSLGNLQNLVSLNIRDCKLVTSLPDMAALTALRELLIDETQIKEITLPDDLMKRLQVLSACDCKRLKEIPEFFESSSMRVLSFKGCKEICRVPDSIRMLQHLEKLDLSETMIRELPSNFRRLKNLEILRMQRTFLNEFAEAITEDMIFIKEIDFSYCGSLQGECDVTRLNSLRVLKLAFTGISRLLISANVHHNLQTLEYGGPVHLQK